MGWKNVKEYYGITHIVQVTDEGICIGSGCVHNIIVIRSPRYSVERGASSIGRGVPFDGLIAAMESDRAKLRDLIESPDAFTASIPVYTFNYQGDIIRKFCEVPGWPNITHDGQMMYDNTHFSDRASAVEKARAELAAARNFQEEALKEARLEVGRREKKLANAEAALLRLEEEAATDTPPSP